MRQSICILLLLFSKTINADNPVFSTPFLASLIGSKTILSIKKDSSDVLWIGTDSGLFRYDGSSIHIFNAESNGLNHIPSSTISKIEETSEGTLLVATYGAGLLQWSRKAGEFLPADSFEPIEDNDLYLRDMLLSQDSRVWVLSTASVFLYGPESHEETLVNEELRHSEILRDPIAIGKGLDGNLLVSVKTGVYRISLKTASIEKINLNFPDEAPTEFVTAFHLSNGRYLYVGTNRGRLKVLDPYSFEELATSSLPNAQNHLVSDITSIENKIIVATDNGVFQFDSNLMSSLDISNLGHGITHKDITAIEPDSGSIWVGTYRGLELLGFSNFRLYTASTGDIPGGVSGFEESSETTLLISTYNGLFNQNETLDTHTPFEIVGNSSGLVDSRISSLERVEDSIWIGFYSGGVQLVNLTNSTRPDSNKVIFRDYFFTNIEHQTGTEFVWLSTLSSGIAKVSIQASAEDAEWYLEGKRVLAFKTTVSGEAFASSGNKIYRYNSKANEFALLGIIEPVQKNSTTEINSIAIGHDGVIWLGTRDYGLYKLTNNSSEAASRILASHESGIANLSVHSIEVDDYGNLWCSTSNGIIKLDPRGNFLARFTKSDGLQGDDFELGASFKNSKGELFFGGPYGYNRFHPDDIEIDQTVPQVRLTDVDFPDREGTVIRDYRDTEEIILTHKDRSVAFRFSILDYTNPAQNQFRYILEGFDDAWTEVGAASFAKYTNLPAGDYQFRVQAANPAGIWNTDGLSVSVRKSPPPWLSWWAFMIYAASFLVLWWTSNRVYQSYTFRRKTEKLQQEKLALEIRSHDELQEQMEIQTLLVRSAYQHNKSTLSVLDTALTDVSELHSDPAESRFRKWLHVLGTLEKFLYYFADNPTANLHEFTNEIFSELLEMSHVQAETLVTINDVTEKYIPTTNASPLALIIYELLENATQHAFLPDSHANYLHVRLREKDDFDFSGSVWELDVLDDGVGFEFNPDNMGPGLRVVHALVGALGGSLEVDSASGCKIRVVMPDQSDGVELDNLALSA